MTDEASLDRRAEDPGDSAFAVTVYVIYVVALFTGVPFLIGVVLAYVFRGSAPGWIRSHFDHQVGIFWRVFLGGTVVAGLAVVATVLSFVVIGLFLWPVVGVLFAYLWVWTLVRCVRGMQAANAGRPYDGPVGWRI